MDASDSPRDQIDAPSNTLSFKKNCPGTTAKAGNPPKLGSQPGFDHGAGHPFLLLYDAKISRGENVNNFNSLDYNPFIVSTSLF